MIRTVSLFLVLVLCTAEAPILRGSEDARPPPKNLYSPPTSECQCAQQPDGSTACTCRDVKRPAKN